jgi:hypothetical protein
MAGDVTRVTGSPSVQGNNMLYRQVQASPHHCSDDKLVIPLIVFGIDTKGNDYGGMTIKKASEQIPEAVNSSDTRTPVL